MGKAGRLARAEVAWRTMIKEAIAADVKVVLLTPTPDLGEDLLDDHSKLAKHSTMIQQLAETFHIPVVDVYGRFNTMNGSGLDIAKYMSQSNHPNELGNLVVLLEIVRSLLDN